MKLYLKMFRESLRRNAVMPISLTNGELLAELAFFVPGFLAMLVGVVLVFMSVEPGGIITYSLGFSAVICALHIKTMARVRDATHVCDENCR